MQYRYVGQAVPQLLRSHTGSAVRLADYDNRSRSIGLSPLGRRLASWFATRRPGKIEENADRPQVHLCRDVQTEELIIRLDRN